MVDWKEERGDGFYFHGAVNSDYVAGLGLWLQKIVSLAIERGGDWSVLVADLWPNDESDCRLIGFVQMDDAAIGYDTGFRVSADLGKWKEAGFKADTLPQIKTWLGEAAKIPSTQKALRDAAEVNPFELRITIWGEGPISNVIKIDF